MPGVPGRGLSPTSQVINTESPKDISHITGSAGAGTETPTSVPSGVTAVPTTSKKLYGMYHEFNIFFLCIFFFIYSMVSIDIAVYVYDKLVRLQSNNLTEVTSIFPFKFITFRQ